MTRLIERLRHFAPRADVRTMILALIVAVALPLLGVSAPARQRPIGNAKRWCGQRLPRRHAGGDFSDRDTGSWALRHD